jgi:voltage-gated potassium channel
LLLFLIVVAGTLGYHVMEGWPISEAFYATVVTLGTVGYGDFYPKTEAGRFFAVFLIIFGVGTMAYTFAMVMDTVMEGRLRTILGRGKLKKQIEKMRNHYIICGCGKIGQLICAELAEEQVDFIVIDNNHDVIQRIVDDGFVYVNGSAIDDKTLTEAGIERAKAVVCCLPSDADNLYCVLTAKELNPAIYIVSRFEENASERRLLKAGADRVISPYKVGGLRMAMTLLRPAVMDFIEITTGKQSIALSMEEVTVAGSSRIAGKSLADSGIRSEYGIIVVAVRKESGKMIFNPAASYVIEAHDNLVALGEAAGLAKFSGVSL